MDYSNDIAGLSFKLMTLTDCCPLHLTLFLCPNNTDIMSLSVMPDNTIKYKEYRLPWLVFINEKYFFWKGAYMWYFPKSNITYILFSYGD